MGVVLLGIAWLLVHNTPRILSLVLPSWFTLIFGATIFVLFVFVAFLAAYVLHDPIRMAICLVKVNVGLWFMMASTSGMRGSDEDKQFVRRVFIMLGLLVFTIVGSIYITDYRAMAIINLLLVTCGFWVTTNYLRLLDTGPRP